MTQPQQHPKTPFQQVVDDLTGGCGCACHTGTGYRTACEHCEPQSQQHPTIQDAEVVRCGAVHDDWPYEPCGAIEGHSGQHSYHPHVEEVWAALSRILAENKRLRGWLDEHEENAAGLRSEVERLRELLTADCEWCEGECRHLEEVRAQALSPTEEV